MSSSSNKSLDLLIDYFKVSFEVRVEAKIQKVHRFSAHDRGSSIKLHIVPMITSMLKEY